ncbi:MAG: hypothetical protein V3V02_00430 [Rhizobiaceae bacterium]
MGQILHLKTNVLLLSLAIFCAGLPTVALAQSTTGNDATAKIDKNLSIATKEQAELDGFILGPWVFLTDTFRKEPSSETLKKAIVRCATPAKLEKLKIESGAEKKLPEVTDLRGDLIYYRTKLGLQRFDVQLGKLTLLNEVKKSIASSKKRVWAIHGRTGGHTILFANAAKRGGKAQMMLEDAKLYLRCNLLPVKLPATNN